MFGANPIRKQSLREDGHLVVQEIFPTLQGEGPFAGRPAIFVRLAGCNLRCWFCDTDFESRIDSVPLSPEQIIARIDLARGFGRCKTNLVVLTGGEPMRQNILPFLDACTMNDLRVQIESAGTLWVPGLEAAIVPYLHCIVCSPKTPKLNEDFIKHCQHYKYVIAHDEEVAVDDGLPFYCTQSKSIPNVAKLYRADPISNTIWVQACDPGPSFPQSRHKAEQRCAEIAMRYGYRLSLQQHKILNLP